MDTKKLRQKILDLAIHGKLVPQDPNDEPASVLLERIKAEKEQLIKEGKIKRQKKSASSDTPHYGNDVPFEIPEGWVWCRLKDITELIEDCPHSTAPDEGKGYPLIRTPNIGEGHLVLKGVHRVSQKVYENRTTRAIPKYGDIIYARDPAGNAAVIAENETVCLGQRTVLIRPFCEYVNPMLLTYFMLSPYSKNSLIGKATGPTVQHVNMEMIRPLYVPIPPFNEQTRIVSEIERMVSLIDIIEHSKVGLQSAVNQAKSKILNLALSGKLTSDTSHYEKWPYLSLSVIFYITMGQSPESCHINHSKDGVEFHQGKLHFGHRYLQDSGVYTDNETKVADAHSLLMCVRAPVGVINITERRICIGRGLCALKLKDSNMPIEYWYYALSSLSRYFEGKSTGSTFKAITMDVIRNTQVRVPTIIEQKAIVCLLVQVEEIANKILVIR